MGRATLPRDSVDPQGSLDLAEPGRAAPGRATLSLGRACTNACVFCAQHGLPGDGLETGEDLASRTALEALRAAGADRVTFGGGEPTLAPERLLAATRAARALGFASIAVQTNGHALAPIARELADAGLSAVHLSVHGADAAVHDYHTDRDGSFDRLWTASAAARAASLQVVATTVLTRSNFRSLSELPILLSARGVAAWHVAVPLARGRAAEHFDRVMPRLALALPFALHALEVARKLGLPAYVSGAPSCLLGPFASRAITTDDDAARAFHARCEACPARRACSGLDPTYLARFDGDELRGRDDRPTRADGEPLAALFAGAGELAPITERAIHEPAHASRRALPVLGRPKRAVAEATTRGAKTGEALREILPGLFERAPGKPEES